MYKIKNVVFHETSLSSTVIKMITNYVDGCFSFWLYDVEGEFPQD